MRLLPSIAEAFEMPDLPKDQQPAETNDDPEEEQDRNILGKDWNNVTSASSNLFDRRRREGY